MQLSTMPRVGEIIDGLTMKDYADRTWATRPDSEAGRMARVKEMRAHGVIGDPKVRIGSLRDDYLQPLMFKRIYK